MKYDSTKPNDVLGGKTTFELVREPDYDTDKSLGYRLKTRVPYIIAANGIAYFQRKKLGENEPPRILLTIELEVE